jgi:thiamine monophosphate kinase
VFEEIPNDLAQLALSSTGYRQVFEEPLVRASKELDSGWRVSQALQYGKSYRLVIEVDQTQIDEVSTNYNDEVTFTLKIEVSARQARDLKSHSPSE